MRITITPTASNTPTPSVTASQTPSYTPTGTVCPGLTPTATNTPPVTSTTTMTPTATPTNTPSQTGTNVPTPSVTATPSETPSICTQGIYSSGQVRATCSDYCNTNYLIHTLDVASQPYGTLTIGDFICGYEGQSGYIAYSDVYTDTNTGPFRIADIDGSGEILGIYVCSGGFCVPL